MNNLIDYFKKTIYLYVLICFSTVYAGSFEDFFTALKADDPVTVQQLLARGFDVNTLDPQAQHGLVIALQVPSLKAAGVLINAPRINVNVPNAAGESPLMMAALKGHLDMADKLIKKGADVNKTGWTPLHYAASNGHTEVLKLLLSHHAYIDAESPNGSTPLMMASLYGNPQSVKLLLDEGADPLLKNQQGLTALQFAERGNRPDAAVMLTKAMRSKQLTGKW